MKAWIVSDIEYEAGSLIVFAETADKAIIYAMYHYELFDDCLFDELEAKRFRAWDKHYQGQYMTDFWHDPEYRKKLVKDFNWICRDYTYSQCESCSVNDCCKIWRELNDI